MTHRLRDLHPSGTFALNFSWLGLPMSRLLVGHSNVQLLSVLTITQMSARRFIIGKTSSVLPITERRTGHSDYRCGSARDSDCARAAARSTALRTRATPSVPLIKDIVIGDTAKAPLMAATVAMAHRSK